MDRMKYFMLKYVKRFSFVIDKFFRGKHIVKVSPVLTAGILIFSTSMLSVSCKTCKCPAYSMHETNKPNTSNASKDQNFLFDKRMADVKTGINQSI
jgi:formate hydrogenlyase subunit 6/NADH:ubiquinone oxidoreductase subunit I